MEDIVAVDTETTGLGVTDRAFATSWKITGQEPKFVDFRTDDPHEFISAVSDYGLRVVCHNASFDYRKLLSSGFKLDIDKLDDTVIRATQINEHEFSYSLDALSKKYLGREKESEIWTEMAQIFGGRPTREAQIGNIANAPREVVKKYALPDADLAHDLWVRQQREIERQGLQEICDFERSIMPAIIENEMAGIRVDIGAAERAVSDLSEVIEQQSKQLFALAGKQFNINSSTDVGKIFKPKKGSDGRWYTADGHVLPSTPGGKASFSADALREMNSPLARAIVDIRSMVKTRDTFLLGHVLSNAVNGRVYPNIHQTKGEDGGTGTGRFSYSGPAMQQIPSRNKAVAAIVKPIFLPDEGQVWVDADMASFEVRVFAHLVQNEQIIRAYADNPDLDLHRFVAELTGLPRNAEYSGQANAKQLNLSMIFNSGNGAIAEKMGMPFTYDSFMKGGKTFVYKKAGPEAEEVIARYHESVPGVKKLATRAKQIAETYGYVETHYGRRLRFPRGEKTYKASGLTIQATAADINKMNWLIIREVLAGEGRLILNTHDSYGLSLPEDWQPRWNRVKEAVEGGFPWFRVPIRLELSGAGRNWWEALGH